MGVCHVVEVVVAGHQVAGVDQCLDPAGCPARGEGQLLPVLGHALQQGREGGADSFVVVGEQLGELLVAVGLEQGGGRQPGNQGVGEVANEVVDQQVEVGRGLRGECLLADPGLCQSG